MCAYNSGKFVLKQKPPRKPDRNHENAAYIRSADVFLCKQLHSGSITAGWNMCVPVEAAL